MNDDPTVEFLDLLDEEVFPTNSDAVLIISHLELQCYNTRRNIMFDGTEKHGQQKTKKADRITSGIVIAGVVRIRAA